MVILSGSTDLVFIYVMLEPHTTGVMSFSMQKLQMDTGFCITYFNSLIHGECVYCEKLFCSLLIFKLGYSVILLNQKAYSVRGC
jgi:hypothetical protein